MIILAEIFKTCFFHRSGFLLAETGDPTFETFRILFRVMEKVKGILFDLLWHITCQWLKLKIFFGEIGHLVLFPIRSNKILVSWRMFIYSYHWDEMATSHQKPFSYSELLFILETCWQYGLQPTWFPPLLQKVVLWYY